MSKQLPLLFACSGCSNAGELADRLARELNRRGIAEMSCLAGVGAAKTLFLKKLIEREVWVIDGCPIECSLGVFAQFSEHVNVHIRLHDFGVRKNAPLPTGQQFDDLVAAVLQQIAARNQTQATGNQSNETIATPLVQEVPQQQEAQS